MVSLKVERGRENLLVSEAKGRVDRVDVSFLLVVESVLNRCHLVELLIVK